MEHLEAGTLPFERAGGHPLEWLRFVHPEPDDLLACSELAAQSPAHPQVAPVVDDMAKNVPGEGRLR